MSTEQKTEYPTRKKLEDERKKGNVPISKEFITFLVIIGYTTSVAWFLPEAALKIFDKLKSFFYLHDQYIGHNYFDIFIFLTNDVFSALFSITFFIIFISIIASIIQTGFVLSARNITPSWDKISIINGFKRIFSSKAIIEIMFAIIKFFILVVVIFVLIAVVIVAALNLYLLENIAFIIFFYDSLLNIFIIFTIFAGLVGVLDLLYKNYHYINSLKMTKQEIKDELKDTEGNPLIKSKLRSIRKNIIKYNIRNSIKSADVVITNPTHYAVALQYDEKTMPSPKVIAKGQGLIAVGIKELAYENKIAVIENQILAQSLYKKIKIGDFIKEEHYAAVAEIINYVYKNRKK